MQAFNLAPNMDRPLRPLSPGRKIVVSFTTKYAFPGEIKSRILELSTRKSQSNFSIDFICFSCEEKGYYHVVSLGQLSFGSRPLTTRAATISKGVKKITLPHFFSIFESGGITKHLNEWPFGKQSVFVPLDPQYSSLREHLGSRGNKTHCFPWGQSLRYLTFWWVVKTTLYQLILQSWYKKKNCPIIREPYIFKTFRWLWTLYNLAKSCVLSCILNFD